jgi:hypothetical protein
VRWMHGGRIAAILDACLQIQISFGNRVLWKNGVSQNAFLVGIFRPRQGFLTELAKHTAASNGMQVGKLLAS